MNVSAKHLIDGVRGMGLDRTLRVVMAVLVAITVMQGLRYIFAGPLASGFNTSDVEVADRTASSRAVPKTRDEYRAVLEKGVLGRMPTKKDTGAPPVYLFGVMGDKALLGPASSKSKPYIVGDDVRDGEKLVEIRVREVVLEKDGEKRTIDVFASPSAKPSRDKRDKPSSPGKIKAVTPPHEPPPKQSIQRPPSGPQQGPPPGRQIPPEAIEHLRAMQSRGEKIPAEVLKRVEAAGITL